MLRMRCASLAIWLLALSWLHVAHARCRHDCNFNGKCGVTSVCECFDGWEGNECNRRTCPKGPIIADIATAADISHQMEPCSGRGACDHETGLCRCDPGFGGTICSRVHCINECSGHGECFSLRTAAAMNDGHAFNRTTTYALWDADVFHGCKCDPGYEGYDCSLRGCELGPDPRVARSAPAKYETVTLACRCPASGCAGRFKLNFMGQSTRKWLQTTSTARELANTLLGYAPKLHRAADSERQGLLRVAQNDSRVQRQAPVWAGTNAGGPETGRGADASVSGVPDDPDGAICRTGDVTYTNIHFKRFGFEMPALGIFANQITGGSVVFETYQTLRCDCTQNNCNGTLHITFDGEISRKMFSHTNSSEVTTELKRMRTIQAAEITAIKLNQSDNTRICKQGFVVEHTYKFTGPSGNVARMGLWSAIAPPADNRYGNMRSPEHTTTGKVYPQYWRTQEVDAAAVLTIVTNDGRDDNMHVCNGIGSCDYRSGVCQCPHGWTLDPDLGPCAKQSANSSSSNGISRCPGTVHSKLDNAKGYYPSRDSQLSHPPRAFMSTNRADGVGMSRLIWHEWQANPPLIVSGPNRYATGRDLLNLTTAASAGPVAYDAATERLFFVDNNAGNPFIGVMSVAANLSTDYDYGHTSFDMHLPMSYTVFVLLNEPVSGLAFDADVSERKLYWTYKGAANTPDGKIAYASVDDKKTPVTVGFLATQIADDNMVVDPMGLAMHPREKRIYWVDRCCVGSLDGVWKGVINSANIHGDPKRETIFIDQTIGSHTSTTRLSYTEIIIDYLHNNTALVMDAGSPPALIAVPLSNYTLVDARGNRDLAVKMRQQRLVASGQSLMLDNAVLGQMAADVDHNWVVWTDHGKQEVMYAYAEDRPSVLGRHLANLTIDHNNRRAYDGIITGDRPVGIALDFGYSRWGRFGDGEYMECFGNGVCDVNNNFKCRCFEGYYGDCSKQSCPKGRAWFHEPVVDNVAHDVDMECSNMGACDHVRGICACRAGFEGAACERMSCGGQTLDYNACSGNGRCLTMRELARARKTVELDADAAAVYGSKLWSAATWDADMAQGCRADEYGYVPGTLHNISNTYTNLGQSGLECPYGIDLLSSIHNNDAAKANDTNLAGRLSWIDPRKWGREEQKVLCTANAGSFTLTFRNYTTALLAFNAGAADAKAALEALPSVGEVEVTIFAGSDAPTLLCSNTAATNHYFEVLFLTELSNTPLLKVHVSDSLTHGTAKVLAAQRTGYRGLGTLKECSGKGECNRRTGECVCWPHWGSSDGFGGRGTHGDCGFSLVL